MRDTVAETVAAQVGDLIGTLQAMGLRKDSIVLGLQIGLDRARQTIGSDAACK